MSDFNLTVTIDTAILPTLIDAGYKLCIAKKVASSLDPNNSSNYTVVWQGSDVLPFNQFTWSSKYQVFGSVAFQSGALVRATTNVENITGGETATLDKYGIMHSAAGASDNSGIFTVQNDYGLIHIGVNSYVNGTYSPSYVSAKPGVAGPTKLQPIESVMVWFDTEATTGTMLLHAASQAIPVDFTSIPTHTLLYKAPDGAPPGRGVWYLDEAQPVLPMTYNLTSNSFSIPEPDEGQLALMTELLNSRPRPAFTVPVVAAAEYESEDEATSFEHYLSASKPEGFVKWEVSKSAHTVSVEMQVEAAVREESSVRAAMSKYLELLYAFDGARYKTLVSTVHGRPVEPIEPDHPVQPVGARADDGKHRPDAATGTAVVRFHNNKQATAFSEQVNGATSRDTKFGATARGPSVTVKFEAKGSGEGAHKRVRQAYDAAVAAFESLPGGAEAVYVGPIVWNQ